MSPRRRHERRPRRGSGLEGQANKNASIIGVGLITLVIVVFGLLLWFYQTERTTLVELNSTDLCPKDVSATPPTIFVVLIDQTDALNELARKSVSNAVLAQMQDELEHASDDTIVRHARIEIWTFSDRQSDSYRVSDVQLSLSRVLSMCNPGAPAKWDHLYKNADVVKRLHARFYASVGNVLDRSLNFPDAQSSPVIEAIYGVGAKVFSALDAKDSRKRLIIVSDLMQNTPALRAVSGARLNFDSWRKTNIGRLTMPNLEGVRVTALVIPGSRPDLQRSPDFAAFWMALFKSAGAVAGGQDWLRQIQ